jgi:hypothetical protein
MDYSEIQEDLRMRRYRKTMAKIWRWVQIVLYTIVIAGALLAFLYTEIYNHTHSLQSIKWEQAQQALAWSKQDHLDFENEHPAIVIK